MKLTNVIFLSFMGLIMATPLVDVPKANQIENRAPGSDSLDFDNDDVQVDAAQARVHHGDGTYYPPGGTGACGSPIGGNNYAAVAPSYFGSGNPNNAKVCGRKVRVSHGSKSTTVVIRDKCANCGPNDIDLNPAAFKKLAPLSQGRINVSWKFISN